MPQLFAEETLEDHIKRQRARGDRELDRDTFEKMRTAMKRGDVEIVPARSAVMRSVLNLASFVETVCNKLFWHYAVAEPSRPLLITSDRPVLFGGQASQAAASTLSRLGVPDLRAVFPLSPTGVLVGSSSESGLPLELRTEQVELLNLAQVHIANRHLYSRSETVVLRGTDATPIGLKAIRQQ